MNVEVIRGIELAFRRGERSEAEAQIARLVEAEADSDTGLLAKAVGAFYSYEYAESLEAAQAARVAAEAAGDNRGESCALRWAADALRRLSRYDESLAAAETALDAAREAGSKLGEANALRAAADALRMLGRHEASLSRAELALDAAPEADDKVGEAYALWSAAEGLRMLSRYEESLAAAEAALAVAREAGDRLAEANALRPVANALGMLRRHQESLGKAEAAVVAAQVAGDKVAEANALDSAALALLMLDRYEESLSQAEAALDVAREAGSKLAEANALNVAAHTLGMLGRHEESLLRAETALDVAQDAGYKLGESNALRAAANALRMLGRDEESLSRAESALAAAREAGSKLGESNALNVAAHTLGMLGRHEESLSRAETARDVAQDAGYKLGESNALGSVVLALSALGRKDERAPYLQELREIDSERAARLSTYPVRPGWHALIGEVVRETARHEKALRSLLQHDPVVPGLPAGSLGAFVVLRKWASYTGLPIIAAGNNPQPGGGCFLWWQDWGLVIDPGLGFGRAFRQAQFVLRNISAVVATHHHIDHTGDIPAIVTCLFEMNEGEEEHEMDFVLGPGAFSAFANGLGSVPGVRSLQLLRAEESANLDMPGAGSVEITACAASHRDLTGRDDAAVGVKITLQAKDKKSCVVGYSSDTRYTDQLADFYKDVDLMIVHIGSVYPYDIGEPGSAEPWHLGFSGTVRLLEGMKKASEDDWDPLILVSEWGEELREHRTAICKALRDATGLPRIWPAELGVEMGLCDRHAKPICRRGHVAYASEWDVDPDTKEITFMCDRHRHGAQN